MTGVQHFRKYRVTLKSGESDLFECVGYELLRHGMLAVVEFYTYVEPRGTKTLVKAYPLDDVRDWEQVSGVICRPVERA